MAAVTDQHEKASEPLRTAEKGQKSPPADRAIPEVRQAGIVLRGNFNPLIFRPDWLVSKGLVPASEVETAVQEKKIDIIHSQVVMYHLPSLTVQVRPDIMIVETTEDPFVRICDLVLGCFAALPETPVSRLGINMDSHFNGRSEDHCHLIGDVLAPKGPWKALLGDDTGKRLGGLKSITMQRKPRPDKYNGHIEVKVEPSVKIQFGIYVHVNDHYEIEKVDEPTNASEVMRMLKENWQTSIAKAMALSDAIMAIR